MSMRRNSLKCQKISSTIESVKFIPPRIGGKGFGRFRVQYKHSVYTVDSESEDENHDREFAHGL